MTSWIFARRIPLLAGVAIIWGAMLLTSLLLTPAPFVFRDEAIYFLPTIHGFAAANYAAWEVVPLYPSYLYFRLYGLFVGADPYVAVKLVNCAFVLAAFGLSSAVARLFLGSAGALCFGLAVAASPFATMARFAMPEPMYLAGFWGCVLIILTSVRRSELLCAVAAGLAVAALALVKPHALSIAIGTAGFLLLRSRLRPSGWTAAGVHLATFYIARLVIGYALTGQWLWSLSGQSYSGMIGDFAWLSAAFNAVGHAAAIILLIGAPAVVVVWRASAVLSGASRQPATVDLSVLACCLLAAAVAMTVYFSQSVYQVAPDSERITRLHGRYYVFVMPLVILAAAAIWRAGQLPRSRAMTWAIIAVLALAPVAVGVVVRMFEVGVIDYPDLALFDSGRRLVVLWILSAVPVLFALWRRDATAGLSAAVAWWASLSAGTAVLIVCLAPLMYRPKPADQAFLDRASPLHGLIGRSDGVVFGTGADVGEVTRVQFWLRSLATGRLVDGADVSDAAFPPRAKWAILLPGLRYSGSGTSTPVGALTLVVPSRSNP